MKKVILSITSVISALVLCLFILGSGQAFGQNGDDQDNSAGDEGGYLTIRCRCHTSNNQCYGGNAISMRELCYMGPNDCYPCPMFNFLCE